MSTASELAEVERRLGARYNVRNERRLRSAAFMLCDFEWRGTRESAFSPPHDRIEFTDMHAYGRCLSSRDGRLVRQGPIRFFTEQQEFYSRWSDHRSTSLFCVLDMAALTGTRFVIGEEHMARLLNVRSNFLSMVLGRVQQELVDPRAGGDLLLDALGLTIAVELVRHFETPHEAERSRGEGLGADYVLRLERRLRDQRFQTDLETLSNELGVTPRHFARLFKAAAGDSFMAFVQRCFVTTAKDLLMDHSLLVKEVAFRCGFSETSSFSRAFRRGTGRAPESYRRSRSAFQQTEQDFRMHDRT